MKKSAETERKLHILLMALTGAFVLFLVLKLCGCFDFTSSYGITHITSDVSDGEGALMLDGDALTYWNTYDRTIGPGDAIRIYFGSQQTIRGIRLDMDAKSDPDAEAGDGTLEFSYRADGDWQSLQVTREADGAYRFSKPVATEAIRIAVAPDLTEDEAADLSWRIKELEIDEE